MKPIEKLEFTDDYMFGAVLKDEEICKRVLELLLNIKIRRIEYPELQKAIKVGYEVHGIRLDVYVQDSDCVYDIEIQNNGYDYIGNRTRFYQSIIDADSLLKGQHYSELVDSKVIFICKTDPFNKGYQVYTFENICLEDFNIKLNDKTQKLIYNSSGYLEEENKELQAFMHYVSTAEATDSFTELLQHKVESIKDNEQFRSEYLKMYIGMEDEKRRAVKEAVQQAVTVAVEETTQKVTEEKALSDAKALLKEGISVEVISRCVGLEIETVQQLAENLQ